MKLTKRQRELLELLRDPDNDILIDGSEIYCGLGRTSYEMLLFFLVNCLN